MFVITIDQRGSSRGPDRVVALLDGVNPAAATSAGEGSGRTPRDWVRPFQRTAGDEVQGVSDDAEAVVGLTLSAARSGHWSIGIGVGAVRHPLPVETRAGAGEAFEAARRAVERAKHMPGRVAVVGPERTDPRGHDDAAVHARSSAGEQSVEVADLLEAAEAALQLLSVLEYRRSDEGQEAGRLADTGLSQRDVAERLSVTQQAVSARLRSGLWNESRRLASAVSVMMDRADRLIADRPLGGGGEEDS